jgi:hypothetical protein
MYYKTKRTSDTGLKFQEVAKMMKECTAANSALSDRYGFKRWRHANFMAWGGISAVIFSESDDDGNYVRPDSSFWKEVRGGYLPKRNTADGKKAYDEFLKLPVVEAKTLNDIVGYKPDSPWSHIGFSFGNDSLFLFSIANDTDFTCPSDCEEITYSEYKSLSKEQSN